MEKAEDAVFGQKDAERATRKREDLQRMHILVAEIERVFPQAMARLEGGGFQFDEYPVQRREIRVAGERRIGWRVETDGWDQGRVYIMGDGSLVCNWGDGRGTSFDHSFIQPSQLGVDWAERTLKSLERMAGLVNPYKERKVDHHVDTPEPSQLTKPKPLWRQFLDDLLGL